MNNRLYSHLYLHLKNVFTLKKSSTLANLLMENSGNGVKLKTPEEKLNFKKRTCIFT